MNYRWVEISRVLYSAIRSQFDDWKVHAGVTYLENNSEHSAIVGTEWGFGWSNPVIKNEGQPKDQSDCSGYPEAWEWKYYMAVSQREYE